MSLVSQEYKEDWSGGGTVIQSSLCFTCSLLAILVVDDLKCKMTDNIMADIDLNLRSYIIYSCDQHSFLVVGLKMDLSTQIWILFQPQGLKGVQMQHGCGKN